jgi:hypothetical protein
MATSEPQSVNAAPLPKPLTGIEASKRLAAYKAVEDHFDTNYRYIGIGSGSTVVYVVEAIAAKGRAVTSRMIFVPTYGTFFYRPQSLPLDFTILPKYPQSSSSSDTAANCTFLEATNPNS